MCTLCSRPARRESIRLASARSRGFPRIRPSATTIVSALSGNSIVSFVLIDCRHGAVAEHRVRNVIANREFARACNSGNSIIGSLRAAVFLDAADFRAAARGSRAFAGLFRFDGGHAQDMETNAACFNAAASATGDPLGSYRFFCLLARLVFARLIFARSGAPDGWPSRRRRACAFRRSSSCFVGIGGGRFVPIMSPQHRRAGLDHKRLNKDDTGPPKSH